MPYINLPPVMSQLIDDLDKRLRRLETAYRFNAPVVDFSVTTPTNVNVGDIYYNSDVGHLVYWDGTQWHKLNQSNM